MIDSDPRRKPIVEQQRSKSKKRAFQKQVEKIL